MKRIHRDLNPRRSNPRPGPSRSGFTLIELLVVISIILVLLGIGLKVREGLMTKASREKARAELAVLAQALADYKNLYGDYPWVETEDGAKELYRALIGNRRPTGPYRMVAGALEASDDRLVEKKGQHFVELSKMTVRFPVEPEMPRTLDKDQENIFVDPWDKPYVYRYKRAGPGATGEEWENLTYVLMSHGADQDDTLVVPEDGILDKDFRDEERGLDNIFAQ